VTLATTPRSLSSNFCIRPVGFFWFCYLKLKPPSLPKGLISAAELSCVWNSATGKCILVNITATSCAQPNMSRVIPANATVFSAESGLNCHNNAVTSRYVRSDIICKHERRRGPCTAPSHPMHSLRTSHFNEVSEDPLPHKTFFVVTYILRPPKFMPCVL
jgi:hypothetical protein